MQQKSNVKIVRVGPDPFGRGDLTVFYRDYTVRDGAEVFYLWASAWPASYPDVPIPPDGYDAEPFKPNKRRPCVPYVLAKPGRLSNLIQILGVPLRAGE